MSSTTPTLVLADQGARTRTRAASLPMVALGVVVVAAFAALVVSLVRGEEVIDTEFDTAVATVRGASLVALPDDRADPAVGLPAPTIEGEDLDGDPVLAPTRGRPTVVLFVAHWCGHCQAEVPIVQRWLDEGRKPVGVDLVTVATAMDATRSNYPTSEWLDEEGWASPTLADGDNHAAAAYGLAAFPFWVVVGGDGKVVERRTGELTAEELDGLFATAALTARTPATPRTPATFYLPGLGPFPADPVEAGSAAGA
ncbi:MAG TPA: thioredoxin family protein [Acidimicrobiales bacterium]